MPDPEHIDAVNRGDGIGVLGSFRRLDLAEQGSALIGARQFFRHGAAAVIVMRHAQGHAALAHGIIFHALDYRLGLLGVADHGDHDSFRPHVAGPRDMVVFLRRHAHDGRHVGGFEIADGALHRFKAEARMLKIKEDKLAARRLHDMADARRGKFHDEMAELEVPVAGHGLQVVTRHVSLSFYQSGSLRSFAGQIVLGDGLGNDEGFAFAVEHLEMPGFQMGVEGGAVIIDFIEKYLVAGIRGHQHVEAPAARLVGAGIPGVPVDEFAEGRHGAGLQNEINGDDKAAHRVASRTFQ